MLPRIPPTGKYVELPLVVVMKIKGNRILHDTSIEMKNHY